jgi:adenylate kinase family enzyme
MHRIAIVGSAGAGKSRLACRLGDKLGRPVIHADKVFWRPGWTDPDTDQYRRDIRDLTAGPAWIFDGNLGRTADIVLPRTDLIVWIEQPMWLCGLRAYGRTLHYLGRTRPDVGDGCPERPSLELWRYVRSFDAVTRPRLDAAIAQYASHAPVNRLVGDRAVRRFIKAAG